MRIRIDRMWKKRGYTISRVFINGQRFGDGKKWCSVLEDEDRGLHSEMSEEEIRKIKIPGRTAIPRGVYEVRITYSPKFKRYLPLLLDVKGYSGVRWHAGNGPGDTEGCLLPGVNDIVGRVSNSKYWFNLIYERMKKAADGGERVWCVVG